MGDTDPTATDLKTQRDAAAAAFNAEKGYVAVIAKEVFKGCTGETKTLALAKCAENMFAYAGFEQYSLFNVRGWREKVLGDDTFKDKGFNKSDHLTAGEKVEEKKDENKDNKDDKDNKDPN